MPMPQEGEVAPALEIPSHEGKTVRLADFRGRKVVVFFYPRAATPG